MNTLPEGGCLAIIILSFVIALIFFLFAVSTDIQTSTALTASFVVFCLVALVSLIKALFS